MRQLLDLFLTLVASIAIGYWFGRESAQHDISMSCLDNHRFERHLTVSGDTFVFSCKHDIKADALVNQ
jgi:hypothetical protein